MQDCTRWALLHAALPRESRAARREAPELEWTPAEHLLRSVEYSLRAIAWTKTAAAQKRGARCPERPLPSPGERAERERRRDAALAARREIDRALGIQGARPDREGPWP